MGDNGPTPVTLNIVLNSEFATQSSNGAFRFTHPIRSRAVKVQLGTIELAPTQRPIEEDWSCIVFTEGFNFPTHDSRIVRVAPDDAPLSFPMSRNPIVSTYSVSTDPPCIEVTTEYPHALIGITGADLTVHYGAQLGVVLTPSGLSLSAARIENVSSRTFRATWDTSTAILQAVAAQSHAANYEHGPSVQTAAIRDHNEMLSILEAAWGDKLEPTSLRGPVQRLVQPYSIPSFEAYLRPKKVASEGLGNAFGSGFGRIVMHSADTTKGARRSSNAASDDQDSNTPVVDPSIHAFLYITCGVDIVPVPMTATCYTVETIGTIVNSVLELSSSTLRLGVTVLDDGRVRIASQDGTIFGVDFRRPDSVPPSSLGFASSLYDGRDAYVSEDRISYPVLEGRTPRLLYRLKNGQEDGTKLAICSDRPIAPMRDGKLPRGELFDIWPGDLVHLAGHGLLHIARQGVTVEFDEMGIPTMSLEFEEFPRGSPGLSGQLVCAPDATFTLLMNSRENGIIPRCIVPSKLGFRSEAYVERVLSPRGPVCGACVPSPAHVASGMPALDHPAYVLLRLSVNNVDMGPAQKAVVHNENIMSVFAKVCIANYRVERANPTEITLSDPRSLQQIDLTIYNPDGTLYNTHGAPFGVSINIVTLEP